MVDTQRPTITATKTVNGPQAKIIDAATALYDRKMRQAAALDCRDLFDDLTTADHDLITALQDKATIEQRLVGLRAELGNAETMVALRDLGGTNAETRKRLLEKALYEDPFYGQALTAVRRAEAEIAEKEVVIESKKRLTKRIERNIEYRTSVLRYLGA